MPEARRSPAAAIALSVGGIALLAWWIHNNDPATILNGLQSVGVGGFAGILALALLRFAARSYAWAVLMRQGGDPVPFGRVVAASIAGDTAGNLTPLSLLVSEPTKALYLRGGVPLPHALASLAAENFFYSLSVAIAIIAGTGAFLAVFTLSDVLRFATLATLGAMLVVLAVAVWLVAKRPAVVSSVLARLPFRPIANITAEVRDLETRAYGFIRATHGRVGVVIACEVVFHAASVAEAYLALFLITGSATLLNAFILDTVQRAITVIFRVVPLRLGVDQFGSGLVSEALGLGAALGGTMAVVRLGRTLVSMVVGLGLLLKRGVTGRST